MFGASGDPVGATAAFSVPVELGDLFVAGALSPVPVGAGSGDPGSPCPFVGFPTPEERLSPPADVLSPPAEVESGAAESGAAEVVSGNAEVVSGAVEVVAGADPWSLEAPCKPDWLPAVATAV
jgi:hypothetical protein